MFGRMIIAIGLMAVWQHGRVRPADSRSRGRPHRPGGRLSAR